MPVPVQHAGRCLMLGGLAVQRAREPGVHGPQLIVELPALHRKPTELFLKGLPVQPRRRELGCQPMAVNGVGVTGALQLATALLDAVHTAAVCNPLLSHPLLEPTHELL